MENQKTYNGYTNKETWKINLEQVSNHYENYNFFRKYIKNVCSYIRDIEEERLILSLSSLMQSTIKSNNEYNYSKDFLKNVDWDSIAEIFYFDEIETIKQ
jgi:hypothetical protein